MRGMDATSKARHLREQSTNAERKLWRHLRNRNLEGHKFRRQQPIGKYIVDFVCFEKKMIIELDGGQHSQQAAYDSERTDWLQSQGFRVVRFWNNHVLGEIEAVKRAILEALMGAELPSSSQSSHVIKGEEKYIARERTHICHLART